MDRPVILCVDDEKAVLHSLRDELKLAFGAQYSIELAENADEALRLAHELHRAQTPLAVLITDQLMPGMKGDDLLVRVHQRWPNTRNILLTGQATGDAVGNAVNRGGLFRYIAKPWHAADLVATVTAAMTAFDAARAAQAHAEALALADADARALSVQPDADTLLLQLATKAGEAAQASYALAVQWHRANPVQAAEWTPAHGAHLLPDPAAAYAQLPAALRQQVVEQRTHLVLDRAFGSLQWIDEPFFAQHEARSVVATPLLGPEGVQGLLYLHHSVQTNHFNPLRQAYVQRLSQQAGVSLPFLHAQAQHARQQAQSAADTAEASTQLAQVQQRLTSLESQLAQLQHALLPPAADLLRQFFPDSVILRGEDLGAAFPWVFESGDQCYLALVQPAFAAAEGLLQTLAAHHLLSMVVADPDTRPLTGPRLAVDMLRQLHLRLLALADLPQPLRQLSVAMLRIDVEQATLEFAGAGLHGLFWRGEHPFLLQGLPLPLGDPELQFPAEWAGEIPLAAGDLCYLATQLLPAPPGWTPDSRLADVRLLLGLLHELHGQPLAAQANALVNWTRTHRAEADTDWLALGLRI